MSICLVISTMPNYEEAENLAFSLLTKKLAACVQIDEVKSLYVWQQEIRKELEARLFIKTSIDRYEEVRNFILANHSYEVPQVIKIDIDDSDSSYLQWIYHGLGI